jgi:beta-glucosidase
VTAAALVLAGCGKLPMNAAGVRSAKSVAAQGIGAKVQAGFLWGVSTAGYQYEGYDTSSNWAKWDADGKTVERNIGGADGLNRYTQDIELAASLGTNAFRTSIEWARVEPKEGQIDAKAVAYYHDLLKQMKGNGQTPIITLHHFATPQWFHENGGWENGANAEKFGKWAAFVAKEFGSDIEYYITHNEPNVYIAGAFLAGAMPPGKKNPISALKAVNTMVRAHRLAFHAIHQNDAQSKVSFNWYTAEWALRGLMDVGSESEAEKAVKGDNGGMLSAMASENGQRTIDYVSFDYYCKLSLKQLLNLPRVDKWEVYPVGMYNALKRFHARYKLPILIAENGMATWDGAARPDRWTRSAYLVAHIREMQRAMAEGVKVLGYVHWSITDNYEWGTFSPRFGLFRVECRDKNYTRIPTDGVQAFIDIIANSGVNQQMTAKYLPGTIGGINLSVPIPVAGNSSRTGVSSNW